MNFFCKLEEYIFNSWVRELVVVNVFSFERFDYFCSEIGGWCDVVD